MEHNKSEIEPNLEKLKAKVNSEKEKIDQAIEELTNKQTKVNDKKAAVAK